MGRGKKGEEAPGPFSTHLPAIFGFLSCSSNPNFDLSCCSFFSGELGPHRREKEVGVTSTLKCKPDIFQGL
jgi:hypothetical protein